MMTCMSKRELYKDAKNDDIVIMGDHIEIDPEGSAGHPARSSSASSAAAPAARRSRGSLHDTHTRLGGAIN